MEHTDIAREIDDRIRMIAEELGLPVESVRRHIGGESRRQISAVLDEGVIAMLDTSTAQLRQRSRSDTIAIGAFLVRLLVDLSDDYEFVVRSHADPKTEIEVRQLWNDQGVGSLVKLTVGGLEPAHGYGNVPDLSAEALARFREKCDAMFVRMQEQSGIAERVFRDAGFSANAGMPTSGT